MQMGHFLGKQFGSYRLVREIARGGFGTVYQAQHTILPDRLVAIKVLHDLLLNSSQEHDAFLQEARFLELLKHPFILPLLDVGIQQNIPFLVTEYAASGSLRMRLQAQAPQLLSFQEILTILAQTGEALQYAHQQNIIHRDLKPDNILFNLHDDALLADFGVATILSTASIRHTSTTGTPAYMAPEQFRGEVSRETDQYSLGCIAYELFTGRKPFAAPDFIALGFKHATEQPIPPRQFNPRIPEPIEQAILKAMAKERGNRYRDIATFITALQSAIPTHLPSAKHVSQPFGGSMIQISPITSTTRISREEANRKPVLLLTIMFGLSVIGLFWGMTFYRSIVIIVGMVLLITSIAGLIIISWRRGSTRKPRASPVTISRNMPQIPYMPTDIEVTREVNSITASFTLSNRHVVICNTSSGLYRLHVDGKAIPPAHAKSCHFKIEEVDCLLSTKFLQPQLEVGGIKVF